MDYYDSNEYIEYYDSDEDVFLEDSYLYYPLKIKCIGSKYKEPCGWESDSDYLFDDEAPISLMRCPICNGDVYYV